MAKKATDVIPGIENYSFYMRTSQAMAIKVAIEALKELLSEVNFYIFKDGIIEVTTKNKFANIIIIMRLAKFEIFHCDEDKIIGVNIDGLNKILKSVSNNDVLTLYLGKNKTDELGIEIDKPEDAYRFTYNERLMDLEADDDVRNKLQDINYKSIIKISSNVFPSICKQMMIGGGSKVSIISKNNSLLFDCQTKNRTIRVELKDINKPEENDEGNRTLIINRDKKGEIIENTYELKFLNLFNKCASLGKYIEMYFENDYPLILKYNVGQLGDIKFILSNVAADHNAENNLKKQNETEEDAEYNVSDEDDY